MPGQYSSLEELVAGERAYAAAQERGRVVRLLNELIEQKRQAAQGLGLTGAVAVEELMESGFKDVSWADLILLTAPQVLQEARELVRE